MLELEGVQLFRTRVPTCMEVGILGSPAEVLWSSLYNMVPRRNHIIRGDTKTSAGLPNCPTHGLADTQVPASPIGQVLRESFDVDPDQQVSRGLAGT